MGIKIDSRQSWIVALATSLLMSCSVWTFRCAGLIYVALIDQLGVSAENASWPIVIFCAASSVLGPAVGAASMYVSIPTLFIFSSCSGTLSVVLASYARNIWEITLTLGLMQGSVLVTRYFDRYQTTAIGVFLSGPAIVSMALTLVMQAILDEFGLQWSLLLLSGLTAQSIPAALLIKTIGPPEEQTDQTQRGTITKKPVHLPMSKSASFTALTSSKTSAGRTGYTDYHTKKKVPKMVLRQLRRNKVCRDTPRIAEAGDAVLSYMVERTGRKRNSERSGKPPDTFTLLRLRWFYALLAVTVGFIFVNTTLLNLIVALARDKKVTSDVAGRLVALLAFGDLLGRICSGWITDKEFISREHLMLINYTLLSVGLIGLGTFSHPITLCFLVTLIGWLLGSSVILFTSITRNRLGFKLLALSSGWYFFFGGILALTRPPMIGYFQYTIGSFDPIMYLMAAVLLVCAILYIIALWFDNEESPNALQLDQWEFSVDEELDMRWGRDRATSFTSSIASL
ncbi:monocarboxylate transporter 12-like isoform X4 [Varroa destructor]|uniref:Monocarboxylate transporter n=1 Tax=Varroa destructor TaxID=109461 RepID=A0A7M7MI60_VARDE|nr:monocarboxylate transporter 12-like isoform X4 [Varroa destructor]